MRLYGFHVLLLAMGCRSDVMSDRSTSRVPTDTTCQFVRVQAHMSPDSLVREFVARDARGEFARSSAWLAGAVSCPGHEGAPDQARMAENPRIRPLARGADSLLAEIRWDEYELVAPGAPPKSLGVEVDTLAAVRTAFGWRIVSRALDPHLPLP